MRLKLVLVCSIIAAIAGAGGAIAVILSVFSSLKPIGAPTVLVLVTFLLPIVTTFVAALFVYRHTARRRKLQAVMTALLSLVLIVGIFVGASIYSGRTRPIQPQPAVQPNVG
jgi:uncharacterized membrane protein